MHLRQFQVVLLQPSPQATFVSGSLPLRSTAHTLQLKNSEVVNGVADIFFVRKVEEGISYSAIVREKSSAVEPLSLTTRQVSIELSTPTVVDATSTYSDHNDLIVVCTDIPERKSTGDCLDEVRLVGVLTEDLVNTDEKA